MYISKSYRDNVYFSHLICRKQHNMEIFTLLLNNSDAHFVRPLHNSIHTHLDIIENAYFKKACYPVQFYSCNRHKESKNSILFSFLQLVYYTALGNLLDLWCLSKLIYKMGIITPASQGCYVGNYLMCAKSFEDITC